MKRTCRFILSLKTNQRLKKTAEPKNGETLTKKKGEFGNYDYHKNQFDGKDHRRHRRDETTTTSESK